MATSRSLHPPSGLVDSTIPSADADLVRRAAQDPAAFAELYRQHHPVLARYVRRRVGDTHLAEDVIAETFERSLDVLGRWRDRGLPFRHWLYRTATHAIANAVRRSRSRAEREQGGDAIDLQIAARDDERHTDPDAERVRGALMALPAHYQSALTLHYLEGLSVADIARIEKCRVGTIKARLFRGREQLRSILVQTPHASR